MVDLNEGKYDIQTRLNYIFSAFIDYSLKNNETVRKEFVNFCNQSDFSEFSNVFNRNEDSMRSKNSEMHPNGEISTLKLLDMANISPHDIILDAGCGHGGVCRIIAEKYENKIIGIDNNAIKVLDAIINTKLNCVGRVKYYIEDAYNTNFNEDSFDIIVRQHAVYGKAEDTFLKECYRLLKEEGRIAFQGVLCQKNNLFINKNSIRNMETYSLVEYCDLIASNGFKILEVETNQSTEELLNSYKNTNPQLSLLIEKGIIIGVKIVAKKVKVQTKPFDK